MTVWQFFRRYALLLPVLLTACAGQGVQGTSSQRDIARVEAYFKTVDLKAASFSQVWPDGAVGRGTLVYRPGYLDMRFTEPHFMTLHAEGRHAVFSDSANGAETRIGLARNPLGLLLDNPVRLGGAVTVTDIRRAPGVLQLSLARTDNPSQGLVTLRFHESAAHLSLYEVRIVDERRRVTLITLGSG
ncbi:LolA family protein [Acetobacter peroxydans]|jgi:outer membrane lipoprotein-sorting protein|uniref:LolA family protein n=1 Tax=Acetobacter peroxydans TaxID=104098 RepID=UPI00235547E8|nr:hypothetical protein [Acetobacter peroxydans]MCH4143738.1 hypothetical protein [Acetobacter peroxydans]MCI1410094.1 hypothetical protein [Acetobacter peroxydans]MCI1566852.1 hypothetical protein [Acetobacter peroxydans]MCI1617781.1 hypothetical protein [Acetobacter peroxydans]MCI1726046.1 hypothetical protein [Acetobacter peroxydans]